jgi:cytochrome c-type biogenesis protein CcmH/NrfG
MKLPLSGCASAARWTVKAIAAAARKVARSLSATVSAPRWVVVVIVGLVASVLVPGWITMMLLLQSVEHVEDRMEANIKAVERNQVCLLQELHVEPHRRGPATLERFSACPDSLPATSVP